MNPPVLKHFKASAVVAATAITLSGLAAAPALADTAPVGQNAPMAAPQSMTADATMETMGHPHRHGLGKVVARTGVNIRKFPTTKSKILGAIPHGKIIKIKCKVRGENVDGNNRWYKLAHRPGWVSARWVKNLTHIPWCKHH